VRRGIHVAGQLQSQWIARPRGNGRGQRHGEIPHEHFDFCTTQSGWIRTQLYVHEAGLHFARNGRGNAIVVHGRAKNLQVAYARGIEIFGLRCRRYLDKIAPCAVQKGMIVFTVMLLDFPPQLGRVEHRAIGRRGRAFQHQDLSDENTSPRAGDTMVTVGGVPTMTVTMAWLVWSKLSVTVKVTEY
jgi:hypothetical protein